ncbi:MAG: hypothetical protein JXA23_09730, partial [Bacteroidales bacterium]|nr:hypothetical protein [Bacteroidales bacterium]
MKTLSTLFSLLLLSMLALAQTNPRSNKTGAESQPVYFSMPENLNLCTLHSPFSDDGFRFEFDSLNITYQGSWALGQSFSVSCYGPGNIVFIGSGAGVIILDATTPESPIHLSDIHTRGLVDAIFYDESTERLCLSTYFAGFEIWDVSDFSAPVRLGRGSTEGLPRGGIFASGNYVYVVTVVDGLQVFDVTDPSAPVNIGNCFISTILAWNSAKSGEYIFVALGNGGMKVIDVSDPANPVIAGSSTYLTTGVWVENGLAYIVGYNFGLRILDVSDLTNITEVGSVPLSGSPQRVMVTGNDAYIANATTDAGGGINIVDVSVPASPQLVSTYEGYASYVTGNGLLVAYTGSSFPCTILDVSDPSTPLLASTYPLPISTMDIAVSGNYAYVGNNGFRVFDITDHTHPVEVGYHSADGALIELAGDKAVYIRESMTANNPVMIMDIANPLAPSKTGQYMSPYMTNDLTIKDQYAYIACWWDGFRVIDFQNPALPSMVAHKMGWFNGAEPGVEFCYVQALCQEGDYLYLVDYGPFTAEDTRGLYIFDISDPVNPVKVSRYNGFVSTPYDIDVVGDFAYVADWAGGMEVIDVTQKLSPQARGYISLPDAAWRIDVKEQHAFLADYINGGVQVVDVSDPDNLVIDGFYARSGCFALGVRVNGNNIFLADGAAGFQIYQTDLITSSDHPGTETGSGPTAFPNPFADYIRILP